MKLKFVVTKIVTSSVEIDVETQIADTEYARGKAKELSIEQDNFTEDEVEYIVESNN